MHWEAVECGLRAIRAGCATAEVQNNLGYSFWKLDKLQSSRNHLDEATLLNPVLQEAYHNRAKVALRAAIKQNDVPTSGIADIEEAIRLGPTTAELYLDAACLFALDLNNPSRQDKVNRYITQALENGWSATDIRSNPILAPYWAPLESAGGVRVKAGSRDALHARLLIPPPYRSLLAPD